jgi:uncharacterized protein (DUF488 family)
MSTIFTIGYEGVDVAAVVATLKAAQATTLLDVRELPLSRKPGFSKTPLSAALKAADLGYVHLRGLGNPKPNRHQKDRRLFETTFRAHLDSAAARRDLGEALSLAAHKSVCLLCFEGDPASCHRAIVAEVMARNLGSTIEHLNPRRDESTRLL